MRHLAVILTTLTLLTTVPAHAQQSGGGVGQTIGDILSGVLGRGAQVRGHVVSASGPELILRGSDGRTYRVDTSSLPAAEWRTLQPGDAVALAARRGAAGETLVAESIQPDTATPRANYQTVQGTIQSTSGSDAVLRTADGRTMTLDLSSMPAGARPTANQPTTIVYEGTAGAARGVALWAEPGTAARSTSPAPSATEPSASVPSSYQRLHGYVESIGVSTLTLKTDGGQTLLVDTSGVPPQQLGATRPGDVVSVVGQMAGTSFKASVLQKD